MHDPVIIFAVLPHELHLVHAQAAGYLTGVFSTEARASADHIVIDSIIIIVLAVRDDLHVHGPQDRRQIKAVDSRHSPSAHGTAGSSG